MIVEMHMLQNFAPSNLNRDDTGSPKDCEFGGYRRARISSQCLKRAIRRSFEEQLLLPQDNLAERTKRVVDESVRSLAARGRDPEEARAIAQLLLGGLGLKVDDGLTEYLLFLGTSEIAAIAEICDRHWDELRAAIPTRSAEGGRVSARDAKKAGKAAAPKEIVNELAERLNGGKAADLALFGRMLADLPEKNVHAASQVAHAISTHKVSTEFDFYTAVDDLNPKEETGAGMMGTVEFNSACYYRYANVDLEQLQQNLDGDEELARKTVEAFLLASISAVPTGKQNSMAAQNPPSLVFTVVRESGTWSLANAFVRPVQPRRDGDLVGASARALDDYWHRLTTMYGTRGIIGRWVACLDGDGLEHLADARVEDVDSLVSNVMDVISNGEGRSA